MFAITGSGRTKNTGNGEEDRAHKLSTPADTPVITDSSHTRRRDHITPVLRQLRWLPVQRRVEFTIACLAHQTLSSTAPTYLSADIQLVSEHGRRHLRSSSHRTLAVPRTRTTLSDRSFAVAGPRVWNSLPAAVRQIIGYIDSLGNL